ncbi:hypothetical protein C8R43DRAFT_1130977 [Mycena crocata]|nr:hypothetical protein C8R43DRAFT_1130977 [Mycena crocata]
MLGPALLGGAAPPPLLMLVLVAVAVDVDVGPVQPQDNLNAVSQALSIFTCLVMHGSGPYSFLRQIQSKRAGGAKFAHFRSVDPSAARSAAPQNFIQVLASC